MKPILLIIDGMDKSGKTTLINFINKKTKYAPLILDRGPIGYKVYSEIFKRQNTPADYDMLEKTLLKSKHLCIYLYADEQEIKNRFLTSGEKKVPLGIRAHLNIYKKYYLKSKLNKLAINTTLLSVEETFDIIAKECLKW